MGRDMYRVRIRREWRHVVTLAGMRNRVASLILETLMNTIPPRTPAKADLLVEFTFEAIRSVLEQDLTLRSDIRDMQAAIDLVVAYFSMDKEAFIRRFFNHDRTLLERATTARSYRAIVDNLGNRDQIRIVTQPVEKNLLILAGPGSGKTRVVVHRCAYLLRVKRVQPRAVLICCFNHKAALELRRRLAGLVGRDAVAFQGRLGMRSQSEELFPGWHG